jgi:hypothetical protein
MRFTKAWIDEIHLALNTLYLGSTPILGTSSNSIQITSDTNQSINIETTGLGRTQLTSVNGIDITCTSGSVITDVTDGDITFATVGNNKNISFTNSGSNGHISLYSDNQIMVAAPSTMVTGNMSVVGNLVVTGSNFVANVTTVEVQDNIMLLNKGQVGSGVSAPSGAGIDIDRGDLVRHRLVFMESNTKWNIGPSGSEVPIATENYVGANALLKANNLSDLTSTSTALANIGLGSASDVTFNNLTVSSGSVNGLFTNFATLSNTTSSNLKWVISGSNYYYSGLGATSNMGVGIALPQAKLHVAGTILADDDITAFSDARKKTNIVKLDNALAKLSSVSGYTYELIDDVTHKRRAGVLAQEIESILPEVVYEDSFGFKSVAYGNFISVLIEAIKELKSEVDVIKQSIVV